MHYFNPNDVVTIKPSRIEAVNLEASECGNPVFPKGDVVFTVERHAYREKVKLLNYAHLVHPNDLLRLYRNKPPEKQLKDLRFHE